MIMMQGLSGKLWGARLGVSMNDIFAGWIYSPCLVRMTGSEAS
jgi:hypothetical protein